MTPEQWQRIKALFSEAVEQPPEQRLAYVRAHAADEEVRREVEDMLAAHDDDPTTGASAELESSKYVGCYRLLQPIGEGGMGVVYLAEQERPVRRRVALKIIKPGMDSAQVVARFEAERQALAMMDHPNIARVFDAGTTGAGRPYFVMELVQGIPITQYCDGKQLTPRQRLELFIPVCQAIQHAHQKGIIHRDLKPSNVLVITYDGKPVPKVIDFGVAKALHQRLTEKTLFTQFGNVLGTLEYMSPEQTDLDVLGTDTRSDIYSLGVLLYELLTGTTPFDGKKLRAIGYEQMLKTIREEEPPKPSTRLSHAGPALASVSAQRRTEPKKLMKLVSGDLDWIVMKCLEKDRARRYETADGVWRDIQRYLSEEPVEASPPSAVYRLSKLARRYRRWLRVAASFALLLVLATAVSGWQAVRATHAKSAAVISNATAVEAQKQTALQRDRVVQLQRQTQLKLAEALVLRGDVSMLADRADDALADYCQAQDLFRSLGADPRRAELALWTFYRRYPPPLNVLGLENDVDYELPLANFDRAVLCCLKRGAEPPDTLSLRDLADRHEICSLKVGHMPKDGIWAGPVAAASHDLRKLLIGCPDGRVLLWPTDASPARELGRHRGSVRSVDISPDGQWGLSGGDDHLLKLWDLPAGRQACSLFVSDVTEGVRLKLSPDGRTAGLTTASNGHLTLIRLPEGTLVIQDNVTPLSAVREVRFTQDARFALVLEGQKLSCLDLKAGRVIQVLAAEKSANGEDDDLRSMAMCPDGRTVVVCSASTTKLWDCISGQGDVHTGHELRRFTEADPIRSLAFSADGKSLLVAGQKPAVKRVTAQGVYWNEGDGTLSEWDLLEGRRISHTESSGLYLTRDGRANIVTIGEPNSFDNPVQFSVRDARTGRELFARTTSVEEFLTAVTMTDSIPKSWVQLCGLLCGDAWEVKADPGVDLFPIVVDGRTIAIPEHDAINLYDRASGRRRIGLQIPEQSPPRPPSPDDRILRAMSIAPDGRLLFAGIGTELWIWDVETGRKLYSLPSRWGRIASVAFSRNGQVAACGTDDGAIEVLDFSRANLCREFAPRLDDARVAMRANPKGPAALATFGQWYAFRGKWDWAIEYLESARAHGRDISPLTLARCYLASGNVAAARREFQRALERREGSETLVRLCLGAL